MTNPSTDIVRKDSIEELCGHRARAIDLYALALNSLKAAQSAHKMACISRSYINDQDIIKTFANTSYQTAEAVAKIVREAVDGDMWRGFINNTPLGSLMDVQEKKKFEDSLANPPECTPETVFATMAQLAGNADVIFRRGLANAFQRLSRDYKSHDGFKIGDRVILTAMITSAGSFQNLSHYRTGELADVDRCFHVLDGKPAPEYQQGICAAIRTELAKREGNEAATEYFTVRWFQNGNAHLRFKRQDLVEKANKLIAAHFGETIGMSANAAQHR